MKIARYCYLKPLAAMLGSLPLIAWHFICVSHVVVVFHPLGMVRSSHAACEAKLLGREAASYHVGGLCRLILDLSCCSDSFFNREAWKK